MLATAGRFPSSLRNPELFGPEEEVGECSLGARTQSLRGGYWDNQKLILPEGWWSRRLLTLESRLCLPGALEFLDKSTENKRFKCWLGVADSGTRLFLWLAQI